MPYRYLKRSENDHYFHIYCRGANKQPIFLCAEDYERLAKNLIKYAEAEGVQIHAHCLMRNHFHFLVEEGAPTSVSRFMQRLNVAHAMYFNIKYKHSGHLFQGPFGERSIENNADLLSVSAYIHNNPLKIGQDPARYKWSSYSDYLSGLPSWIEKSAVLSQFSGGDNVAQYRDFVTASQDLVLNEQSRPGLETVMS